MYKRAKKRNQKGGALPFAALLPFAAKALPFLGKAVLGGAASFGSSKILGSIFGSGIKKPYIKKNKLYLGGKRKPYIANNRLYLGGRKKDVKEVEENDKTVVFYFLLRLSLLQKN